MSNCISMVSCIIFSIVMLCYGIPHFTPPYPGYGVPASLFPTVLCTVILLFSGFNLAKTILLKIGKNIPAKVTLRQVVNLLLFTTVLAFGWPLMELIGFIPGGIIMTAVLAWLCGMRNLIHLAILSVATTLILYAAFWYGLKVILP